jgi:5-methylcytosine-specific restriction endonuclease McrA
MEPRTLVLNPWMTPHRIATWQDAMVLLVTDRIDVLEAHEEIVRSERLALQIPSVARLRKGVGPFKSSVKFSKSNVFARDGYRCCYCGKQFDPRRLNYDHVLPRSKGGPTDWENVVTACFRCNGLKANRTPAQAGFTMHFQPHKPTKLRLERPLFLVGGIPDAWRPYLTERGATAEAG